MWNSPMACFITSIINDSPTTGVFQMSCKTADFSDLLLCFSIRIHLWSKLCRVNISITRLWTIFKLHNPRTICERISNWQDEACIYIPIYIVAVKKYVGYERYHFNCWYYRSFIIHTILHQIWYTIHMYTREVILKSFWSHIELTLKIDS